MMHIYIDTDLYNKHVQDEAYQAYGKKYITEEAYKNIRDNYTSNLYTPNNFIRIALGLLTIVAIIFSALLVILVFLSSTPGIGMYIILALINYVSLELLVRNKQYYNAGVDNLLMFSSAAFLLSGIAVYNDFANATLVSGVAVIVFLYLSVRFVDGFMAILSYLGLLVFIFLLYTRIGAFAKATAPFLIMIFSAVTYGCLTVLRKKDAYQLYRRCFKSVLLVTILTFYSSVNYFVVKELGGEMSGVHLGEIDPIPFGWLFWVLTFVVPVAYVAHGVKKRDLMFLRIGLVLVGMSVFTFRYYYHVLSVEMAVLIGGFIMIAISYAIIKYLRIPRFGLSFNRNADLNETRINIESLVITQVTGQKTSATTGVEFGGGSFGSGGAGGDY
ncbi:hypothetical protein [Segetibacter aerophilus]|uniref:DUF2157 domain-containing protein n=1 Tax=Segetibacter aerophilus TaxID=670293 RepID=A0A512BGJ1_9BACT|nr:hypothetical protein [Segetibacter aerophilus]GEO10947.1 hypothetical protein SAE01_34430 [Segetibacter aerophilus]